MTPRADRFGSGRSLPDQRPADHRIETVELPYRVDLDDPAERAWLKGQYEQHVASGGADGEGEDAAAVRHALQTLEELQGQILNHMPTSVDLGTSTRPASDVRP
ncbi:hypothetical protein ACSHWB_34985 [Lentzea sp. HUAS TT2]|uniref:hypothetical protein n=1 Tax=Lentzea sp. HUAS TT2 TaxID=3447454 RepID=UPI003F7263A8